MGPEPTLRCSCGESNFAEALHYEAAPRGEIQFPLVGEYRRYYDRCTTCGHYFSRHNLDMGALYKGDYLTVTYGGAKGIEEAFKRISNLPAEKSDNFHRVERVTQFADKWFEARKTQRRLIDIGSGLGIFVSGMKNMGWCCTALDPDERFSGHARRNIGVDALTCNFGCEPCEDIGTFQCVSLNKVLEHVEDPVDFLTKAKKLLASGGFIYIEVPDGEMAIRESEQREEFFIEHHHVFSSSSLPILIAQAGMDLLVMERLREPSGKYTLFTFIAANT